jgi:hypothetical protein
MLMRFPLLLLLFRYGWVPLSLLSRQHSGKQQQQRAVRRTQQVQQEVQMHQGSCWSELSSHCLNANTSRHSRGEPCNAAVGDPAFFWSVFVSTFATTRVALPTGVEPG